MRQNVEQSIWRNAQKMDLILAISEEIKSSAQDAQKQFEALPEWTREMLINQAEEIAQLKWQNL